jgi:hypothetical protein
MINKASEESQIKANDSKGMQDLANDLQNCSSAHINKDDEQIRPPKGPSSYSQSASTVLTNKVADLRRNGDRIPRFEDLLKFVTSAADE